MECTKPYDYSLNLMKGIKDEVSLQKLSLSACLNYLSEEEQEYPHCALQLPTTLQRDSRAGILRPTRRTPRPNNCCEHQVQLFTFDTMSNFLQLTLRPTKLSVIPTSK